MIYPPSQKPPIWSIDTGVIAYNCQKAGIPHPVLAMPFWEGAGIRAMDYSGHGHHGVATGATGEISWITNPNGIGVDFVGDTLAGFSFDPITLSDSEPWTIFFIAESDGDGIESMIMGQANTANSIIRLRESSYVRFYNDVGTSTIFYNVTSFTKKSFYVLTSDGGGAGAADLKLYVDGVWKETVANVTATFILNSVGNAFSSNDYAYDGRIYQVGCIKTTLTSSQVKFLSANPYFMYQIPEELYGYAAAAGISIPLLMQQMNQFDGGTYALC